MKKIILPILLLMLFASQEIFAQGNLKTSNQFIVADVESQNGFVTVLLPGGRIGFDPQLCFQNKCYFTCQIGSTIFTNNEVVAPFPANAKRLNDGTSVKIVDTIRTTWLNKNGCDIIQDIYPVAFSKSGQIVYKWKIFNHTGVTVSVPSQYLQDIQISDQSIPKTNDGPKILTKWQYTSGWVQYPNSTFTTLPWFYIGFLYNLPHPASYDPGLSAMGYLDYGAPLNLTKPFRMTNGDWYTMTQTIFGSGNQWPSMAGDNQIGTDNAILLEFPAVGVPSGKTVEIARTSYGTGEFEKCVGQLFSLVFYPHHLVWTSAKTAPPGSYTPNPIHIEKFVVVPGPPENTDASANTKVTLSVGSDLTLSDSLCKIFYGKSQAKPSTGNGIFISPGGVAYYDWWACADPAYFCTRPVSDTLKFTATCGICPPAFLNDIGADECDQRILIDCAETDVDAPFFADTVLSVDSGKSIVIYDSRPTDRGLKNITWVPVSGTDSAKFTISGPTPALLPCPTGDKVKHTVTITQLDSTIGGCFDFTFEDCLGHQSFHQVCLKAAAIARPDSLPPVFTFIKQFTSRDSCRNIIDSFEVSDNRLRDSGICTLEVISGTDHNMTFDKTQFVHGDGIVRFAVRVTDTLKDGSICIRATDCSKAAHFTDTCFRYCAIPNVGVADIRSNQLSLEANHPNPFSHFTMFSYKIGEYGIVKLSLYDELGRELSRIIEKPQPEGRYTIDFDGSKFSNGSYIIRLESGGKVISRKVTIVK